MGNRGRRHGDVRMNILFDILCLIFAGLLMLMLKKNNSEENPQTTISNLVEVYIEKIGEIYYAWHDKTFIFQTEDTKELVAYIKNKFPNNIIKISSDKELTWLQEAKKELNLN
jgi:hypothetical protein